MSPLSCSQAALARAIRAGDARAAAGTLAPRGLSPVERLRIHRHHHRISLARELGATYPVVARLVGERCFAGLAQEFIELSPPASPCLFDYGSGFARYLAAVPTLMGLPYLPDVARLEWAMNLARHAADVPCLAEAESARSFNFIPEDATVTLHPSVQLVVSDYPLAQIWRANQPDSDPEEQIVLEQGRTQLLVYRDPGDDVAWCPLSAVALSFLYALRAGLPLAAAAARAIDEDPAFDGRRIASELAAAGVITGFEIPETVVSPTTETSR